MKKYEIKIESNTPIIWNVQKKEVEDEKRKLKNDQYSEYEENNWQKKAEYKNNEVLGKEVIIPDRWFKSALLLAAIRTGLTPHYAKGKKERYTTYLQSCLIENGKPVCNIKDLKGKGEFMKAQPNQKKSGKVWRIRPMLEKWETSFLMVDPFGRMKVDELKELVEYCGMFIGLGDSRGMNFGRFTIKSVKEA